MAALVAGVQYGLSSHSNFHENKSLIFVKLTDSAQRAIEDYLKNRNKTSQSPTIQFLGNEGQLSFPSSQSSHGSTGFTFSLSGNHDIEGPQGAFECIQQTGPKSLESLGTLPCKMRIQANDDVYETTRHRMAVAEENSKIKCTRVIKANGPDIGRKVKVKATGRTVPPTTTTSSSSSLLLSSSSSSSSSSSTNTTMTTTTTTTMTTTTTATTVSTATATSNVKHRESLSIPTTINQSSRLNSHSNSCTTTTFSTTATSLSSSSSSNSSYKSIGMNNNSSMRTQQDKKLPELMRRPLKERLIHVLALRPYKKPELYDRITREGIKERDRSTMTTILKQVAFMRDNTYHLHRHVWNDVQEDWPFYNEQDRAMLKRRKPQNLTPPGSSDGSSGSGQSPNSTHPGSPPAITAPPPSLLNSKRPGYYQGNDGLQTKRPRISHYRKPEPTTRTSVSVGNNSSNICNTNANNGQGSNGNNNIPSTNVNNHNDTANWDYQQQNRQHQRDRTDYRIERTERNERTSSDVLHSTNTTIAKSYLSPASSCDENITNNNNKNTGSRYGNTSLSSSSSSSSVTAGTMSTHNTTTSTNSHNNMHNSVTTVTRHNSNIINGNDKVSPIDHSGNSIGAGVNDYMRPVGGSSNINNNNNNNNNHNNSSYNSFGGGSGSNSANNGGNNEGYGASPCNGGVIETRRVVSDSREGRDVKEGRNNDRDRGSDREHRELMRENIGSVISGSHSHNNNNEYTTSSGASNLYIGGSGSNSSSTAAPTITITTATTPAVSTTSGSTISLTPVSPTVTSNNAKTSEYPDYLTQYTAINSTEQRRRYKAEFNSDYEEYRRLHTQVAKVSKRFAQLEERRQRELELRNFTKCEELREQIVAEYISTKNDPSHIETKRRFHYLHEKLSHIKRLVLEYDTQHFGVTSGGMNNNCNDILSSGGDFRY